MRRKRQDLASATENPTSRRGKRVYCFECGFCAFGGWCTVKARNVMPRAIMCEFGRRARAVETQKRYISRKKKR